MTDDATPRFPAVRKTDLTLDRANSRLLERGLRALDVDKVCLEADKLVAFESSVFVFTRKWDPQHSIKSRMYEWETWKERRSVAFYEFHRAGAYIRKITLPLIKFTDEGYRDIRFRRPGKVVIRSTFNHFYEYFWVPGDTGSICSRIDYLFSRNGARRAVWSDYEFADRHRHQCEPIVPVAWWLKPEWVAGARLICLNPRSDSSTNASPRSDGGSKENQGLEPSDYYVIFQEAEEWITLINAFQDASTPSSRTPSIPLPPHQREIVSFPARRALKPGMQLYTTDTTSDGRTVWFFGDRAIKKETHETVVWRLGISDRGTEVTVYTLPHPYDLVRQGVIEVFDDNDDFWVPSEVDYQSLDSTYDDPTAYEGGYYQEMGSWQEDLVMEVAIHNSSVRYYPGAYVLFRNESNALRAVKEVNLKLNPLTEEWEAAPARRGAPFSSDTSSIDDDFTRLIFHKAFADCHLFALDPDGGGGKRIVVTNVNTGAVTWFRPNVPETELDYLDRGQ
jgi:hypothetical protein